MNKSYRIDHGRDLFAPDYQPMVVESDHIWLVDPRTSIPWKQNVFNGDTLWAPDTVVVGRNIQGWKRQKPLTGNSCVSKVNTTPTLVF